MPCTATPATAEDMPSPRSYFFFLFSSFLISLFSLLVPQSLVTSGETDVKHSEWASAAASVVPPSRPAARTTPLSAFSYFTLRCVSPGCPPRGVNWMVRVRWGDEREGAGVSVLGFSLTGKGRRPARRPHCHSLPRLFFSLFLTTTSSIVKYIYIRPRHQNEKKKRMKIRSPARRVCAATLIPFYPLPQLLSLSLTPTCDTAAASRPAPRCLSLCWGK